MILFISHDAQRTGAPIALLHILKWLKENTRLKFEILIKNRGELFNEFQDIAPTYVAKKGFIHSIKSKFKILSNEYYCLPNSIRNKKYDLIYSNTVTNGSLVSLFSKDMAKIITHVHEMDSWIEMAGIKNWEHVISQTNHFIAVSEAVKCVLVKRGILPDLITLIPECAYARPDKSIASRNGIREALGIPDDAFVVGGGGAEMWRKGRDLFVQLAAGVNREPNKKNCHFIWLGVDPDKESKMWLEIDALHAGCQDKVHWVGCVTNPQDYLSVCDIFAMTSREDPMPLIAIEAGMHGLPIVCFESAGGTAEWVTDKCGFSVPYLDVAMMVSAVKGLCQNENLRLKMGTHAQIITSQNNSVENVASNIERVIYNVSA